MFVVDIWSKKVKLNASKFMLIALL